MPLGPMYEEVQDPDTRLICQTFQYLHSRWIGRPKQISDIWYDNFPQDLAKDGFGRASEWLILASEALDETDE